MADKTITAKAESLAENAIFTVLGRGAGIVALGIGSWAILVLLDMRDDLGKGLVYAAGERAVIVQTLKDFDRRVSRTEDEIKELRNKRPSTWRFNRAEPGQLPQLGEIESGSTSR